MIIFQMVFRINMNFKYTQQRYCVIIYYVYKYHHHKTQWIKKKKNDGYPCLSLNVCQYNKKIIISRRIAHCHRHLTINCKEHPEWETMVAHQSPSIKRKHKRWFPHHTPVITTPMVMTMPNAFCACYNLIFF